MELIVGLGNPGLAYRGTRHNIGSLVVKALAKDCKASLKRENKIAALVGRCRIGRQELMLALPLTYMNVSGAAVISLLKKYNIHSSELLVICDDLDLEFGRIKIRQGGSSGGHRGLESILETLGTNTVARLRIGINKPARGKEARDYVLSGFSRQERASLAAIVEKAVLCSRSWVENGIHKTMNSFNAKSNSDIQ